MSTATLKQVATGKKDNPVASFSSFLDKFKPQMALALPKHLTADRMARLAVTAFSSTPKLQECEPKTIVASIMTAATLGLEIGVDGQGFLVPYGRTCQFVPGWKGLVDLVSRSGRATVWTGAVFEGDEFDYALGDSPFIRHRPGEENDPDKITHVYAVGRVNGSEYPVIEVWTIRKVWKHRDKYNKVGAKHYSFRDPEMYARKVPLLQVLKYMPKSIELQNAMAIANAADNGHHAVIDGNFVTVTDPDTGATVDPSTGELTDQRQQQADMALPSYDDLLSQIRNAKDEEVLALVLDSARDLPQAEYVKLEQAYQDRREVLLGA
ncbi:recombinase RecT [Burkholderia cenocepacia]|uniref:recombinase RecT n=1 Tax=Burkholderia cenocepacia TaxID=95486 RepID=UPI0013E06383|nr:recombinase RecT [Burkholderia cenocepacia]MCW3581753.1 recombinase RecT [Burkholderia cenocepacia]MCW3626673.1 recombinase RecT [Burkholderia cenocepacia]MCW3641959.1 recombinase RecT [Burkholderia cenocepacia]MCW5179760.1 recombinase RecT [Burkholderia cenocepacia]NGO94395.1 recombinase RecT [Burkholderia cenocepacia]